MLGLWIDQPSGGIINIAFAGGVGDNSARLAGLIPQGAQFALRTVTRTIADLEAVRDKVLGDVNGLSDAGISVRLLAVDIPANEVVVGVTDMSDFAVAQLRERFGDSVRVEYASPAPTSCTGRESCYVAPLRAGLSGAPAGVAIGNRCSLAFQIHYNQSVQWLTAGHCAQTPGVSWYHAANQSWPLGQIIATCWPQCNWSDAARGGNVPTSMHGQAVYGSASDSGWWPVKDEQGWDADHIGDAVCLNARKAAAVRCGTLRYIGRICYQGNPCTLWFDNMRFADYASQYGDSGGATHSGYTPSGVTAYGVQSGCTNPDQSTGVCLGYGVYSHIARIGVELGILTCSTQYPCP
jgi:hypothetical protein